MARWVVGVLLGASLLASPASAVVTLTASRADVLYTTDTQFDCGELARSMDVDLPFNVVRLEAQEDTGSATEFRWKLPKPDVGFLLRDDPDFDSSVGGAFAIQGFCGAVGSACLLTEESLKTYREPTILYAAPTCDDLPTNTRRQFDGDTVRLRVQARAGKRGLGKATVDVGYGRLGTPVAWVSSGGRPENGIGSNAVRTGLAHVLSVTTDQIVDPPSPIKEYFFDNGGGGTATTTSCAFANDLDAPLGAPACALLEYDTGGTYLAKAEVRLEDGSAYCDNVRTRVGQCRARAALEVRRSPRRETYRSGTEAELTVRWVNRSPRPDGCEFIFDGLTCNLVFTLGNLEGETSTTFVPATCEGNSLIECDADVECGEQGPCLSASHCSATTVQTCASDVDCNQQNCEDCEEGETCIRVIKLDRRIILPGESIELIRETVQLRSLLPGRAKITEEWVVTERFNQGNATATNRYKIRGDPNP